MNINIGALIVTLGLEYNSIFLIQHNKEITLKIWTLVKIKKTLASKGIVSVLNNILSL